MLVLVHARPRVHDALLLVVLLLGRGGRLRLLLREHLVHCVSLWALDDAFEEVLCEDWRQLGRTCVAAGSVEGWVRW